MNRLGCIFLAGLLGTSSALGAESALQPFSAKYVAEWKSISVGSSEIVLERSSTPGEYVYVWSIAARGIFKVIYDKPLVQTSWFSIEDGHARSRKYLGSEGDASVSLAFDWPAKRITGLSENKPVDISFKEKGSAHDINTIQVEVMLDLMNGNLAKTFAVVDKDQLKDFNYTNEGAARLRTAIGMLDTVIVASQRTGNSRILRMWFAPSLGYMPVQAERWRDGKLEFAIRLKSQSHPSLGGAVPPSMRMRSQVFGSVTPSWP